MADRWRLLVTRGFDGATNMAVDEALAVSAKAEDAPILRFFDWRPWAVSLGFHQDPAEIDLARCQAEGVDVVRRPTGGRAILHAEELTYSVVVPKGHPSYSAGISKTYRIISEALQRGLQKLGLPVSFAPARRHSPDFRARRKDVPCFASSARFEIQVDGKKLVGSAQRHYPSALLQHGSILVGPAHLALADFTVGTDLERQWLKRFLAARTVCLNELAGTPLNFDEVADAVRTGFAEVFGADFEPMTLSDLPLDLVEELRGSFALTRGGMKDGQETGAGGSDLRVAAGRA